MQDVASYYNREEDKILIEVSARSVVRLFNPLDPSPIEERDLDEATAEYIASSAREVLPRRPLKLVLYLPGEDVWRAPLGAVRRAVRNYFTYREHATASEFRLLLRRGWVSLAIGLGFLFSCITARQLVRAAGGGGAFEEIVAEGLLISGWVAMWRPLQLFLYDWWPVMRLRRLYRSLASMEVEVKPPPASSAGRAA